jgi:hypothetical protein
MITVIIAVTFFEVIKIMIKDKGVTPAEATTYGYETHAIHTRRQSGEVLQWIK